MFVSRELPSVFIAFPRPSPVFPCSYRRSLVMGVGIQEPKKVLQRWAASFFVRITSANLHRHFGEISLKSGGRLVMYDSFGVPVDARLMNENESVTIGDEVVFPCHRAVIGAVLENAQASQL